MVNLSRGVPHWRLRAAWRARGHQTLEAGVTGTAVTGQVVILVGLDRVVQVLVLRQALRFELGLLIPLVIVDLLDSLLPQVSPINGLCVIVRNARGFACLGDGAAFLVNQAN